MMGFSQFYTDSVTSIEAYSTTYLKKNSVYRITWIGYLLNWIAYHILRVRVKFDGIGLLSAANTVRAVTFGDGRKCLVKRSTDVLRPDHRASQNYVMFILNDDPRCDISDMINDVVASLTEANDVRWKELVCVAHIDGFIDQPDMIWCYSGATVTAMTHATRVLRYSKDDRVVLQE